MRRRQLLPDGEFNSRAHPNKHTNMKTTITITITVDHDKAIDHSTSFGIDYDDAAEALDEELEQATTEAFQLDLLHRLSLAHLPGATCEVEREEARGGPLDNAEWLARTIDEGHHPLVGPFAIQAIGSYADRVAGADPDDMANKLISPEAWQATAREWQKALAERHG